MNEKEKLLNAINGKKVEGMSWSPFLAYYWDFMPEDVKEKGQLPYMKKLGASPLLRGMISPVKVQYNQCEITEEIIGDTRVQCYKTFVGDLRLKWTFNGTTWFLTEHGVKTKEDLKVLTYICEHITFESNVEAVNKYVSDVGDDGLVFPLLGVFGKSSFQSLLEHWIGTENLIYALMDYPEEINECLKVMRQRTNEVAEIAAMCDAEVFISWEDTSTTNISPAYYEQYIRPEIDDWCDILHREGKKYIQHACGHLKHLLPLMAESKIDGIESMSPPPTGNVDVLEAIEILPEHMVLIGGLEPVFLVNADRESLSKRIHQLMDGMKDRRFILANSDSCPPEVTEAQLIAVGEIVKAYIE